MSEHPRKRTGLPSAPVLVVFFTSLFFFLALVSAGANNQSELQKVRLDQLAGDKSKNLADAVMSPLYKAHTLASFVVQNNGDTRHFDELAATLVNDPVIKNVLLAPGGVVSEVYPLQGNEGVLGLNLFGDSAGCREAVMAYQTRKLVMGGPFTLRQGGQGIVGRLPVFLMDSEGNETFWGMVSVTLNYPDILPADELQGLTDQKLQYWVWRVDPDTGEQQTIAGEPVESKFNYTETTVPIMGSTWYFCIGPVLEWYQFPYTWAASLVSLFVSVLIASMLQQNHALKDMKEKLEKMVHHDTLTGLLNRQGLFFELERLVRLEKRFFLYFLDLNRFKQINDSYGHHTGDKVLVEFSRRVDAHTDGSHLFARISGDEFVLVHVDSTLSLDGMEAFWREVEAAFHEPVCNAKGADIRLTFSKGGAAYPTDGDTLDTVIALADERMYAEKRARP